MELWEWERERERDVRHEAFIFSRVDCGFRRAVSFKGLGDEIECATFDLCTKVFRLWDGLNQLVIRNREQRRER